MLGGIGTFNESGGWGGCLHIRIGEKCCNQLQIPQFPVELLCSRNSDVSSKSSKVFTLQVKSQAFTLFTKHSSHCSFEGHFHLYLVWLRQAADFCSDELIGVGQQIGLEYQNWFAVETLNFRPALSTTILCSSVSCQYPVCFPISSCPRWSFAGLRLLSWWDHAVCPVPLLYFSKQPYNQPLNAHH